MTAARTLSAVPTGTVDWDDHFVFGHVVANGSRNREHISKICRPVLIRRGSDCDQLKQTVIHPFFGIGGEAQTARVEVALHYGVEARLMNRDFTAVQHRDFLFIDVDANHVLPKSAKHAPVTRPT